MQEWHLAEADERLKQIVRQANCCGPQHVVLNGEAVVVLSETEYGRLVVSTPPPGGGPAREGADAYDRFGWDELMKNEPDPEAVSWPWDWDCERREWVPPGDHAISP